MGSLSLLSVAVLHVVSAPSTACGTAAHGRQALEPEVAAEAPKKPGLHAHVRSDVGVHAVSSAASALQARQVEHEATPAVAANVEPASHCVHVLGLMELSRSA